MNIVKMFRKDEGFTLVELMVVVLIIGILIAIAVPVFNAARAKAEERTCFSNQRIIEGAFQTYYASEESTPASVAAMVPAYIAATPECPTQTGGGYGFNAAGTVDSFPTDCAHGHY